MKRKIAVVVLVLMCAGALGAFAQVKASKDFPWMVSYNKAGNLNLYASVGLYSFLGFDASVGAEYIFGQFDLGPVPLSWGVGARAMAGFIGAFGVSWIDWGIAPMATIHWGTNWGKSLKFDWYAGLGLGIYGSTYASQFGAFGYSPAFGLGVASFDGVAWHLSDNFALIVEGGYTGYTSVWGVGVELKM